MGFRNAPSCSCCNLPPCYCECEGDLYKSWERYVEVEFDLTAASGTNDCGTCQFVSGDYILNFYAGDFTDPVKGYCNYRYKAVDFNQVACDSFYVTPLVSWIYQASTSIQIDARTYCAYLKDGKIYDEEVEGSKLVGRAFEVRLQIVARFYIVQYGDVCSPFYVTVPGYAFEPSPGVIIIVPDTVYDSCETLYFEGGIDPELYNTCCLYEPQFEPFPFGDCNAKVYEIQEPYLLPGEQYTTGTQEYIKALYVWRTINSTESKCIDVPMTLPFIAEESYGWRLYSKGQDQPCDYYDLCNVGPLQFRMFV